MKYWIFVGGLLWSGGAFAAGAGAPASSATSHEVSAEEQTALAEFPLSKQNMVDGFFSAVCTAWLKLNRRDYSVWGGYEPPKLMRYSTSKLPIRALRDEWEKFKDRLRGEKPGDDLISHLASMDQEFNSFIEVIEASIYKRAPGISVVRYVLSIGYNYDSDYSWIGTYTVDRLTPAAKAFYDKLRITEEIINKKYIEKKVSEIRIKGMAEKVAQKRREGAMAEQVALASARVENAAVFAARALQREEQQKSLEVSAAEKERMEAIETKYKKDRDKSLVDAKAPHKAAQHSATLKNDADKHARQMATYKWLLVAAAASSVVGMGTYFGLRHYFRGRPKIIEADDTSLGSFLKPARYPAADLTRLILTPELEKAVREKFMAISHAIMKHLPLSNMMFFGPAGTGKTMAAQEFVRDLSKKKLADHIIVRGPAFKRFSKTNEAIEALADIIRFALNAQKKTKRPVILVFDEAETLFADRAQPEFSTKMTRDLVTTMTSLIGQGISKKIMFILSTNFPDRIDKALLDRIDVSNRVRFAAPGQKEREDLLRMYLKEHLEDHGFTIADEVMDAIPEIAKSIDGMVGRQISSMTAQSIYPLLNQGETELTLPLFKDTVAATRMIKDYSAY